MARRATKKTVTPKMYQHFAVATLVITAATALLADDKASAELGEAVEASTAQIEDVSAKRYGNARLVRRKGSDDAPPPAASGWGPDNYNASEYSKAGYSIGSVAKRPARMAPPSDEILERLGITAAQFAKLSLEDQRRLLEQAVAGPTGVSDSDRRAQVDRVAEASRLRSGGSYECADC